jgi:hypothetical protein
MKGTQNNQVALELLSTPLPLVPHLEGKGNRKVSVVRIPEGTDITKRDIALHKAYLLAKQKHKY